MTQPNNDTQSAIDTARASGYFWGREDERGGPHDTDASIAFATAYAERGTAYRAGTSGVGFMPNLKSAYETWLRIGAVVESTYRGDAFLDLQSNVVTKTTDAQPEDHATAERP